MSETFELNRARNDFPYFLELMTGKKLSTVDKRVIEMIVDHQEYKSKFLASIKLKPRRIR